MLEQRVPASTVAQVQQAKMKMLHLDLQWLAKKKSG